MTGTEREGMGAQDHDVVGCRIVTMRAFKIWACYAADQDDRDEGSIRAAGKRTMARLQPEISRYVRHASFGAR